MCASTQNGQRLASDTPAATTSLSVRETRPASSDSRSSAHVPVSSGGESESTTKVGALPTPKSTASWAKTSALTPVAAEGGGGWVKRKAVVMAPMLTPHGVHRRRTAGGKANRSGQVGAGRHYCTGSSAEGVAAHMVISPFTAKTHISRAMTKLGARDRAQLVVFAYESGLVEPRGEK